MTALPVLLAFGASTAVAAATDAPPSAAGIAPDAPAPSAEAPAAHARERDAHGRTFKASLGANYDRLFAVNVYGGEASLAVGRRDYQRWGYLIAHLEKGTTLHGLPVWGFRAGPALEWAFGAVHLGGEATLGYLAIQRVTSDDWLQGVCFGAEVYAAIDVATLSESDALFAKLGLGADYYEPFAWGPNLSVGYRWDEHTRE